jgi:hypothetical protein
MQPSRLPRLASCATSRDAAYRRLVVAVLGVDVPRLTEQLRAARQSTVKPARANQERSMTCA